jgi:hypothetical protein
MLSEDKYCQESLVKSSWCVGATAVGWMSFVVGGGRIDKELTAKIQGGTCF